MKRIFTFWEPQNNIPPYLSLCIQTWRSFLPDYEVVICDYANLENWLDKKTLRQILYKKMSFTMQADCIRCALVHKHGGIWMDADTIVTSSMFFKQLQGNNSDVQMIGKLGEYLHGAFIYAPRPEADFLGKWLDELQRRVPRYRWLKRIPKILRRSYFKKSWDEVTKWDYCLNAIIDLLYYQMTPSQLLVMDKYEVATMPEEQSFQSTGDRNTDYLEFYFTNKFDVKADVLEKTQGLVLLHNSWTPERFKKMSAEEFLAQDILLAKLLKGLLK